MKHLKLTKQQQEFWALVQKINYCWYQKEYAQLSEYFHQDIIFNSPDFKSQIIGIENCIQTYIDFLNNSVILNYAENSPTIQIFAQTAIVTYQFEMKYKQNDSLFHETGTDILIFERESQSWKVIWRAISNIANV